MDETKRIFLNKFTLNIPTISLTILTFCCVALIFLLNQNPLLNLQNSSFIAILIGALAMWILRLVPEYIPALLIIISGIMLHVAPEKLLLSGFTSNSFFLAISVLGIGAIISKSRLFYRFSLILLANAPSKLSFLQKLLFLFGALITPIMSVQSSRVALMAPLLDDILKSSSIHPRSPTANALANAAFNGCILLSTVFLTGKSSNFIVFGLLSEQNQWQGNWLYWLWAASFPGLLLITLFFIIQSIAFKPQTVLKMDRLKLKNELYSLGALTFAEYTALASLILFAIGSILSAWKGSSTLWTCLAIFMLALCSKTLNIKELSTRINWNFLFYFGAIIGIMKTVQNYGMEHWILDHFQWLYHLATMSTFSFIIIIYAISWIGGLLLGTMIAPALIFSLIIPIANPSPISNWVVAFVILMATESWIFPYQSSYYLCFEELLKPNNNFHLNPLLKLNAWFSLLKLIILIASIPFWQFFRILTG